MRDLEASFAELIRTLQEAQEAVQAELSLLQAQGSDSKTLLRIFDATQSFGDQAQSLVIMMTDSKADEVWLSQARDLVAFFWKTEETIEATLGFGRG